MDSLIEQINNVYGLAGVTVFFCLMILLKFHADIKSLFGKWFKPRMNSMVYAPKDILLSKLRYYLDFKIESLEMTEYGRTKIFRDLLRYKFESYEEMITNIEEIENFDGLGRRELYNAIIGCLASITESFEIKAKSEGIPSIVIHKYKSWRKSTLDYTLKNAEFITMSPIYKTNKDIMNAVYLLNIALLELTIAEAEKGLSDLNGELTGLEYKGYTIGK